MEKLTNQQRKLIDDINPNIALNVKLNISISRDAKYEYVTISINKCDESKKCRCYDFGLPFLFNAIASLCLTQGERWGIDGAKSQVLSSLGLQ